MSDEKIVLRARIVALRQEGYSYGAIETKTGVSKSVAFRWCQRFEEDANLSDRKRSGRPPVVTAEGAAEIVESLKRTRSLRVTQRELHHEGVSLSLSTIHSHATALAEVKSVRKKPLLTEDHKEARLQFARLHIHRPLEFWRSMLFTDEKSYETFRPPSHVWVVRGESAPVQPTVKRPPKIQLWAGISYYGITSLYRLYGKQTSASYVERLEENLQDEVSDIFTGQWTFMHDSTCTGYGVHGAAATQEWLNTHVRWLKPWPANSPDLNPIENVWGMLTRQVESRNPKSVEEYSSALDDAWAEMDQAKIRNLIDSMPRRLRAVIDAEGGNTKY